MAKSSSQKIEFSKAKILSQSKIFFISRNKKIFTKLKQTFVEAWVLNYFDPKYNIQIEKDIFGYIICENFR